MAGRAKTVFSAAAIFKKAFKVLLIDDEEAICSLARVLFEDLPLFQLDTVNCAREADRRLDQGMYHLCFCDLGVTDLFDDQYYLVNKYHARLPVIILSGRASMEESATCMFRGAAWVFDKPAPLDRDFFAAILNRFLLPSLFLYGMRAVPHSRYPEAIETLLAHKPASVEEWARIMNVNERYVRKICACCPLPLHHLVTIVHLVDYAMEQSASEISYPQSKESRDRRLRFEKATEFYYLNKSAMDSFLRIGTQQWRKISG